MQIDFKNPESILSWYLVFPERHAPQLQTMARVHAQFAQAIRQAARLARERGLPTGPTPGAFVEAEAGAEEEGLAGEYGEPRDPT